jgi:hypothetical protein
MLDTFKKRFTDFLFDTIVHVNVKLKESAVVGKPVVFFDKYCRGAKDYHTLAKELILLDKQEIEANSPAKPKAAIREEPVESSKSQQSYVQEQEDDVSEIALSLEPEILQKTITQPFSEKMQEVVKKEAQEFFTTRFALETPGAKSVYVTGSFNDWSLDDGCRLEETNGQWEVKIPLKPGTYKYQFIVDGVWKEDPKNTRRERNSFGDINSIVEVKSA